MISLLYYGRSHPTFGVDMIPHKLQQVGTNLEYMKVLS
jgi:hypothetical protein